MLKEFREFAMRGNVIDMAVGIIMGGAFGKIVNSLVSDIIMPPIGRLTGGLDYSNLFIPLSSGEFATLADAQAAGVATLNYGLFFSTVLNFVIIALAIFIMVKWINTLKRQKAEAPAEPPAPSAQEALLSEIRDLLKNRPV